MARADSTTRSRSEWPCDFGVRFGIGSGVVEQVGVVPVLACAHRQIPYERPRTSSAPEGPGRAAPGFVFNRVVASAATSGLFGVLFGIVSTYRESILTEFL